MLYGINWYFVCQIFASISPLACTYLSPVYFPSIHPLIRTSPIFTVSPAFTFAVPFCALIFVIIPVLSETTLQYSFVSIISGLLSAFTNFTIALVPFISIPIHAISLRFSLNLFIISFVFTFCFKTPFFSPASSISLLISTNS